MKTINKNFVRGNGGKCDNKHTKNNNVAVYKRDR